MRADYEDNALDISWLSGKDFNLGDLARVEQLAVVWDYSLQRYIPNRDSDFLLYWLHDLQHNFPNLKRFTIVKEHFKRSARSNQSDWVEEDHDLKFVNCTVQDGTFRVNGYRIDESVRRSIKLSEISGYRWSDLAYVWSLA